MFFGALMSLCKFGAASKASKDGQTADVIFGRSTRSCRDRADSRR